jgi:hypothetical protein
MRAVWLVSGVLLSLALPSWAPADDLLPAVWKEQRLDFSYLGLTSRYSCQGLRDKMRALLLDLGARRDLKVAVTVCDESGNGTHLGSLGPSLRIDFFAPVLADAPPKPTGELAVDGVYETFTLTNDPFRNFGIGDCELVEQFVRQVLPKFVTRDLKQDITCVPYQQSGTRFFVRGEVLRAAKTP